VVPARVRVAEPADRPGGAAARRLPGEQALGDLRERGALGARERLVERRRARVEHPPPRPPARRRQVDQHAAAVARVARAPREPALLEPVDDPDRARVAQPQPAGERLDRAPARPLVQRRERGGQRAAHAARLLGRVADPVAEHDDERPDHVQVVIHVCS
jgi:hypothetical protein